MKRAGIQIGLIFSAGLQLSGCAPHLGPPAPGAVLKTVAESPRQWTGVAVNRQGRLFVNFPRWSETVPVSVAEVTALREIRPYPDSKWNRWEPGLDPRQHFICVQSVYIDDDEMLWVLDPANPRFEGVVPGGPKLVKIDPATDQVRAVFPFSPEIAPPSSYLNDVRVDTVRKVAYLTDSGTGALVVTDLKSGRSRRLLADHPSTKSEGRPVVIDGRKWLRDGKTPDIHADGIGLDPQREYLYYHALTARDLYRIHTRWLRDEHLSPEELRKKVEWVAETGPVDGIMFDPQGRLYLSDLEGQAIRRLERSGAIVTIVQDERLNWPDTFAVSAAGEVFVTTSQISYGTDPPAPYRVFRVSSEE